MEEWRRSGQIPSFGDWEKANEMPITQYFESARQAGLIRHSSSGDCDQYMQPGHPHAHPHFKKTSQDLGPAPRKINRPRRMSSHGKDEQKKQGKVYDVTEPPRNHHQIIMSNSRVHKFPKPVDEDLYKIPPHLIRNSKRVRASPTQCLKTLFRYFREQDSEEVAPTVRRGSANL